ncbi:MAG: hypothetical protein WKF91_21610 [Segetibacter sp.]
MNKQQLIIKFQRELSLRNYALSTIHSYSGCLSIFLDNYKVNKIKIADSYLSQLIPERLIA